MLWLWIASMQCVLWLMVVILIWELILGASLASVVERASLVGVVAAVLSWLVAWVMLKYLPGTQTSVQSAPKPAQPVPEKPGGGVKPQPAQVSTAKMP